MTSEQQQAALRGVRAILLDIEGTTTPIAFVHDVLFPFARAHLNAYLRQARGSDRLRDVASRLTVEHAADLARGESPPPWRASDDDQVSSSIDAYARWLMDRDAKSPGLKLLQGHIWERGYRDGLLEGQVFDDVPAAIRRWHDAGIDVAIYSSGSELAQRLLFESTPHGDLTPLIRAFFDTAVGPKKSSESYARIAKTLGRAPHELLFISDVTAELEAAQRAGLQVVLAGRPGNPAQSNATAFPAVSTFDGL